MMSKDFQRSGAKKKPANQDNAMDEVIIFLDMDGVISDFDRNVDETGIRRANGSPDYDKMNSEAWYANMPAFDGARDFYDALKTRATVKILTAPITFPECFSGKAKWLMNFVPERKNWILKDLMIVASKEKYLMAQPNRVLIDDRLSNVEAWRKAGGIAIHHTGDYAETLKQLDLALQSRQNKSTPDARGGRFNCS